MILSNTDKLGFKKEIAFMVAHIVITRTKTRYRMKLSIYPETMLTLFLSAR